MPTTLSVPEASTPQKRQMTPTHAAWQHSCAICRPSSVKDPDIHLAMLDTGFPFDAVQMPLNPFDANFFSFEKKVLRVLNGRGIAPLGMKPIGGHGEPVQKGVFTAE
jgi:hypothetical protein